MSTKIYNAFKVNDTQKFMELLVQYREEIIEEYESKKANVLKVYALWLFNEKNLYKEKTVITEQDWLKNITKFRQVFNENRTKFLLPYSHPFDCKIKYFPTTSLGYFTSDLATPHFLKLLELGKGIIEEYEYYNNVDAPEGITEEEWKEREQKWDEVINSSEYLIGVGYKKGLDIVLFEESVTYLIAIEGREEQIALALEEYLTKYTEKLIVDVVTEAEAQELQGYLENKQLFYYMDLIKELKKKYKTELDKCYNEKLNEYKQYIQLRD